MSEFVMMHPEVITGLLTFMVAIIGYLLGALFWSFRRSIDNLATTLGEAITEIKTDRKTDRDLIGGLLDRMQKQETICVETRRHCPAMINDGRFDK